MLQTPANLSALSVTSMSHLGRSVARNTIASSQLLEGQPYREIPVACLLLHYVCFVEKLHTSAATLSHFEGSAGKGALNQF